MSIPKTLMSEAGALAPAGKDELLKQLENLPGSLRSFSYSCFQSVEWLRTWVETVAPYAQFVAWRLGSRGSLAAFAVLGRRRIRRRGFIAADTLWLWETGDPLIDRLSVEYNRPLASVNDSHDRALVALARAFGLDDRFDELYVSAAAVNDLDALINASDSCDFEVIARSPVFWMDLAAIRERGGDILGSLSSNTRSQVRRAIRKLQQTGDLALEFAADSAQSVEWFDLMRPMHESRWQAANRDSAFANPAFETFHRELMRGATAQGFVRMARLVHGDRAIAYQYYLIQNRRAYSYQSAFVADHDDKQIKPGLIAHVLAAQELLNQGFDSYDLLAGFSQYKESLATDRRELLWLRWQKRRLRFRLEARARMFYQRLRLVIGRRS